MCNPLDITQNCLMNLLQTGSIVLDLSKNNISAIASGVVTAEGAAGDLANIITFADNPLPSIPRLVYCLGKNRYKKSELDILITQLLESFSKNKEFAVSSNNSLSELFKEIAEIYKCLKNEKFSSDAFSTICVFLFESSSYLKQILDLPNEIEKSLMLNEIVTALTQAATYRFAHQDIKPTIARKDFAKYFRESLSQSNTPTTSPPSNLDADAVKVMTCHASKGLEFPFVIVTGQTLSEIGKRGEYKWLPESLIPNKEDDLEQSDSALFVGATRAKKGLAVSYARTSSGSPKARQRKSVPLLQKWSESVDFSADEWNFFEVTEKDNFEIEKIWGGNLRYPIASRKLDKGECALSTYLQDALNLKFPLTEKPFYPAFYVAVRKVLRVIVTKTFEEQRQLSVQESLNILMAHWEFEEFRIDKDHIHHDLYWNLAQKYVQDFVNNFIPEVGKPDFIDLIIENRGREIELDLVCAYTINGLAKAIFFRPESLKDDLSKKGLLLWGGIKVPHRNSFILLREDFNDVEIKVFSGEDGILRDFHWGKAENIESQKDKITEKHKHLSNENFIGEIVENTCNYRCANRMNCPHWIGALK
jgi:UvrD-like helicase C-terminal domain